MPGAGVHWGANKPTALANARYGSAVRSTASRGAAASSRSNTADARVVARAGRYLEFATNVRSPVPASSMPATRTISISPSPSRRQASRSASSRNFMRWFVVGGWWLVGTVLHHEPPTTNQPRISRASNGNPFEERRQVLQSQLLFDLADAQAPGIAVERRRLA